MTVAAMERMHPISSCRGVLLLAGSTTTVLRVHEATASGVGFTLSREGSSVATVPLRAF